MKKPKVVRKRNLKLNGMPVWGTAMYSKNPLIEIDSKLSGFNHLVILCHEILHIAFPNLGEVKIRQAAKVVAATLWSQNYRRFEK